MTQTALINDCVMLPSDPLQNQRVPLCGQALNVQPMSAFCHRAQNSLVVNSPTDVTLEGWRREGDFARAVVRFMHDPVRPVLEFMWQDATSGRCNPRYARQNFLAALVPSLHGAMLVLSAPLRSIAAMGNACKASSFSAHALTNIGSSTKLPPESRRYLISCDARKALPYPAFVQHTHENQHEVAERAQAARRVERLTGILGNLGLSMQTLAEVLRVSRPQLYKWFDPDKSISLQKDSVKRLDEIERLAESWRVLSSTPLGPWLRERVDANRSLVDLLRAEPLPVVEIQEVFSRIAGQIAKAPKTRSRRLREAGFARRPSHRSLPSDE